MRIRIRPPRHFGSDRILTIYDVNKAVGQVSFSLLPSNHKIFKSSIDVIRKCYTV